MVSFHCLLIFFSNIHFRVILDARLKFEMNKGSPVTCGYAREEELQKWPRLRRPKLEQPNLIVAELESGPVGVYFETESQSGSG